LYRKDAVSWIQGRVLKTQQFKRFLAGLGAQFVEGTRHTKVYLYGRQTTLPRHREISEQLVAVILKQLGIGQAAKP